MDMKKQKRQPKAKKPVKPVEKPKEQEQAFLPPYGAWIG